MRKFLATLFLIFGISFVALPFIPMGCDNVSALADEFYPTTRAVVPFYPSGMTFPAVLAFDYNYGYGYITNENPYPVRKNVSLIYTDGLPYRETFVALDFDNPVNIAPYDLSINTWRQLSILMLPYIYNNEEWVRAETVPNVYFSLRNKYCTRCNVNRVDDLTFDTIYYFQSDTLNFSQGDCYILFRCTYTSSPPNLYTFTTRLGNIMMSPPVNLESYEDGYDRGYNIGFGEGVEAGRENAYDQGYSDGVSASLSDITPWDMLVQQVDAFFNLSLFGSSVTFGTVLSVGFGMLLMGIAIKIFMGG